MSMSLRNLIFVDCEATGPCPGLGVLTELGAVAFESRHTFHGLLFDSVSKPDNPALSEVVGDGYDPVEVFGRFAAWLATEVDGRPIMVSDNPAFDFPWIACGFHRALGRNPFGHSARRIGDFYAGLTGDFMTTQAWKRLRQTPHDHNPVHDAMGNVEAFSRLLKGER
jgi:hypothetical protein